jgi:hypothetical protein
METTRDDPSLPCPVTIRLIVTPLQMSVRPHGQHYVISIPIYGTDSHAVIVGGFEVQDVQPYNVLVPHYLTHPPPNGASCQGA